MAFVIYSFVLALFLLSFFYLKIMRSIKSTFDIVFYSIEIAANHRLDSHAKEIAIKKAALKMFRCFFLLLLKGGALVIIISLPVWVGSYLKLLSMEDVVYFAVRWDVILGTSGVFLIVWFLWGGLYSRAKPRHSQATSLSYTALDRAMHNLAFGSRKLNKVLLKIEDAFFSRQWAPVQVIKPIFITSLPRSGTTVLLEAFHKLPCVATHAYSDMPFIMVPFLWARVTGSFRIKDRFVERAHGDGIAVSVDSPEAFEEVLWIQFFSHKYRDNQICLWKKADQRFTRFFREHVRKIISLRAPINIDNARYVSKNNCNIARVPAVKESFPDSYILIPVREPLEQAVSLLRQHKNFSEKQEEDYFVEKYMADIGHFEFGNNHAPIRFEGFDELTSGLRPDSLDYWLAYWIAAFRHLISLEGVTFLSYEAIISSGVDGFKKLCCHLSLDAREQEFIEAYAVFRESSQSKGYDGEVRKDLLDVASILYQDLLQRCILNS